MTNSNPGSKKETARYVEKMCAELRALCAQNDLGMLAYLLDVAREEAASQTLSEIDDDAPSAPDTAVFQSRDQ